MADSLRKPFSFRRMLVWLGVFFLHLVVVIWTFIPMLAAGLSCSADAQPEPIPAICLGDDSLIGTLYTFLFLTAVPLLIGDVIAIKQRRFAPMVVGALATFPLGIVLGAIIANL